jgi:hypothetical protein
LKSLRGCLAQRLQKRAAMKTKTTVKAGIVSPRDPQSGLPTGQRM